MNDKIVLFDLFDTLLIKVWFDYDKALNYLSDKYFGRKDELLRLAEEYREKFMLNRNVTHLETSFCEQLKYYENHLGIKLSKSYSGVEWEAFSICREEKLADGATELLTYLKEHGYKLAVLSNSIFSSATLKKYLDKFGLLSFFDDVISSADIGYRKPSPKAFNAVLGQLGAKANRNVFFIGNKTDKDYDGAKEAGLTPVLVTDYPLSEIRKYFERTYLYVNSISERESLADGPGLRTVIYFQGCKRACTDCHNPSTWTLSEGKRYVVSELADLIRDRAINKKITLSGGEPLLQERAIENLLKELSDFDICLYTGGSLDDISEAIKSRLHYVKVGAFDSTCKTTVKPFVGSTNQKFINLRSEE
ncbi:MAG: HAD-IA family hydrolase [Clostridia bacterium]|nr:HAD-IA family hydrolase [Clostridia bacterium]